MPPSNPTLPRLRIVPPSSAADAARLCIGDGAWIAGVFVKRTSLLTYNVAGSMLDLDEVAAEVAYVAAERSSIQSEPSLCRAAEIVGRQTSGAFTVGIERYVGRVPIVEATWESHDWRSTSDDSRAALDHLAALARDMGLSATRVGFHVVVPMPLADRPPLARATHRQSRVSLRQPKERAV